NLLGAALHAGSLCIEPVLGSWSISLVDHTMVLFVSYSGMLGGAERQLLDLAPALEHEAGVACPEGPLADALREAEIRVFPVRRRTLHARLTPRDRFATPLRLIGHRLELRRLVRSLEPQLVVAWGMRSALAAVSLRSSPAHPRVVFQHNDM